MPRRALTIPAVLLASTVIVGATGCSGTGPSDGPRRQICGEWIGRAAILMGSGPSYVDASHRRLTVSASADTSGIWVQVSDDCAQGAQVSVSDPAVIALTSAIPASGGDVAVLITPRATGQATLTATSNGSWVAKVAFVVGPPWSPPSTTS